MLAFLTGPDKENAFRRRVLLLTVLTFIALC